MWEEDQSQHFETVIKIFTGMKGENAAGDNCERNSTTAQTSTEATSVNVSWLTTLSMGCAPEASFLSNFPFCTGTGHF